MSNGSSTGLVATDASSPVDAETSSEPVVVQAPEEIDKILFVVWLASRGEWQAARAVTDAWDRWKGSSGEGQRSG